MTSCFFLRVYDWIILCINVKWKIIEDREVCAMETIDMYTEYQASAAQLSQHVSRIRNKERYKRWEASMSGDRTCAVYCYSESLFTPRIKWRVSSFCQRDLAMDYECIDLQCKYCIIWIYIYFSNVIVFLMTFGWKKQDSHTWWLI